MLLHVFFGRSFPLFTHTRTVIQLFTYQSDVSHHNGKTQAVTLFMDSCVAAGYTGRNQESVQAHIEELKKMGVPTPYAIPALYWITPARLTNADELLVVGDQTSPEVEFFLAKGKDGTLYVTVASDHTDRELEAVSVGKAKQICDKVVGDIFWKVDDVADHWDKIEIHSHVLHDQEWVTYQSGTLGQILHYSELLKIIAEDRPAGEKPSLLSGTIPIRGGETLFTSACKISMKDPVLNREIVKSYQITSIPDRS